MKCPHCGETLPFPTCTECRGEIPEKSRYCCWCGHPVNQETRETGFTDRIICSDGACTGTINEAGVCNFCGKPING